MDLQTAAKRYEEMRHFWAREIAIKLSTGHYRNQVALLRHLAAHEKDLPSDRLFTFLSQGYSNQHSRDTSGFNMLKNLRKAGMITRGQRRNHTYWYRLTELGGLVLMYIPPDQHGERIKKRGRPRKTPALAAPSV